MAYLGCVSRDWLFRGNFRFCFVLSPDIFNPLTALLVLFRRHRARCEISRQVANFLRHETTPVLATRSFAGRDIHLTLKLMHATDHIGVKATRLSQGATASPEKLRHVPWPNHNQRKRADKKKFHPAQIKHGNACSLMAWPS
jgi:hypothetical protein